MYLLRLVARYDPGFICQWQGVATQGNTTLVVIVHDIPGIALEGSVGYLALHISMRNVSSHHIMIFDSDEMYGWCQMVMRWWKVGPGVRVFVSRTPKRR